MGPVRGREKGDQVPGCDCQDVAGSRWGDRLDMRVPGEEVVC